MDFRRDCLGIGMPDIPGCPATSGGFSPDQIAGLGLWLDAGVGVTEAGTGVSVWADQSGSGNNATQGVDASRPTLVNNVLNGHPVVDPDGVGGDFMNFSPLTLTDFTIFIVCNITASAEYFISNAATSEGLRLWNIILRFRANSVDSTFNFGASVGYHIIEFNRSAGSINCFRNNIASADNPQVNANNFATVNPTRVFSSGNPSEPIAELLIYNSSLSAANRLLVFNYLNTKYAIV